MKPQKFNVLLVESKNRGIWYATCDMSRAVTGYGLTWQDAIDDMRIQLEAEIERGRHAE